MRSLQDDDFEDLQRFPLKWRWTDPRWASLPPQELARIRPLRSEAAQLLWRRCRGVEAEAVETATSGAPLGADSGAEIMRRLAPTTRIVVCWDERTAVLTDAGLLAVRWKDFCYPSSDDCFVATLDGALVLRWDHEEEVHVVRRSEAG